MTTTSSSPRRSISEINLTAAVSGWWGLIPGLGLTAAALWQFADGNVWLAIGALALSFLLLKGTLTLLPNEAVVLVLLGGYKGTLRQDGFFWVNPFYSRLRVTLKTRNFNTPALKVNDAGGNPIEVAAVITWRVADTAQALFDVEHYDTYLQVQSETGLREVVGSATYDGAESDFTLRGNFELVAERLRLKIQQQVAAAGLEVLEAKLTHLAYAPEIASVMLRRQQAEAIIQSREKMVQGAIGMIRLALEQLAHQPAIALTAEQQAAMALNMMTVLLSETGAQPVVAMGRA